MLVVVVRIDRIITLGVEDIALITIDNPHLFDDLTTGGGKIKLTLTFCGIPLGMLNIEIGIVPAIDFCFNDLVV